MSLPGREALTALLGQESVRTDDESRRRAVSAWSARVSKDRDTIPNFAAIALPADTSQVAQVVQWAAAFGVRLVPIGGASNLVDATLPAESNPFVAALDLSRLDSVVWDEESLLVRAGAGIRLGALETQLNGHDYTLGQLPQSLELLTVGGAVAMDAVGLLSGRYGRQSDMTLGLTVVLANGEILQPQSPPLGSAAFDLTRLFLGSEGRFGVITEATFRMRPVPEVRAWAVFSFPSWDAGIDALRLIYRSDSRPAAARLLDAGAAADLSRRYQLPPQQSLLLLCFEGDELAQTGHYQIAYAVCQQVGGEAGSSEAGDAWFEERRTGSGFLSANARPDGLADVLGISAPWSALKRVCSALLSALEPLTERLNLEICHPSPQGAALECSWQAVSLAPDTHRRITEAALDACVRNGGAVAHHYGIGKARAAAFAQERGAVYENVLTLLQKSLDAPGVLSTRKPSP